MEIDDRELEALGNEEAHPFGSEEPIGPDRGTDEGPVINPETEEEVEPIDASTLSEEELADLEEQLLYPIQHKENHPEQYEDDPDAENDESEESEDPDESEDADDADESKDPVPEDAEEDAPDAETQQPQPEDVGNGKAGTGKSGKVPPNYGSSTGPGVIDYGEEGPPPEPDPKTAPVPKYGSSTGLGVIDYGEDGPPPSPRPGSPARNYGSSTGAGVIDYGEEGRPAEPDPDGEPVPIFFRPNGPSVINPGTDIGGGGTTNVTIGRPEVGIPGGIAFPSEDLEPPDPNILTLDINNLTNPAGEGRP